MIEKLKESKVFGGSYQQYIHASSATKTDMQFSVFLPREASDDAKVPVVYWLSGLTCNDDNFMHKAGAFKTAAELGLAIVTMDTSPRGDDVPNADRYDLGQGAGFYLNATNAPWDEHFHMYDYVTDELPKLVEANFPIGDQKSVFGHSMGGHGALTIGLKNQDAYRSISAFSPISNPMNCQWGVDAFNAYLGDNQEDWKNYDASELLKNSTATLPILVDQGNRDEFLAEQLGLEALKDASKSYSGEIEIRLQDGYDHSYFFISSFVEDHLRFHAKYLK